jgi:hypothetical protein
VPTAPNRPTRWHTHCAKSFQPGPSAKNRAARFPFIFNSFPPFPTLALQKLKENRWNRNINQTMTKGKL